MTKRAMAERTRSDLAVLVETEARLDRELASAKEKATVIEAAAQARAREAAAELAADIARERVRIVAEVARDTAERVKAIEDATRARLAELDTIRGERAAARARDIVEQLVALVLAEVPR